MAVVPGRLFGFVLVMEALSVSVLVFCVIVDAIALTLSLFASPKGDLRYDGADMVPCRCAVHRMIDCGSLMLDDVRTWNSRRLPLCGRRNQPIPFALQHNLSDNMAAVTDPKDTRQNRSEVFLKATEAAEFVRSKVPGELSKPRVAIVCGSGLGGIADLITKDARTELDYSDIPHFPQITGTFLHDRRNIVLTKQQCKVMRVNWYLDS